MQLLHDMNKNQNTQLALETKCVAVQATEVTNHITLHFRRRLSDIVHSVLAQLYTSQSFIRLLSFS